MRKSEGRRLETHRPLRHGTSRHSLILYIFLASFITMAASIGLEYLKDPFESCADSRLCDSCATLFSNPDDVRRFLLRETISRCRRYQSLVESEEHGCRLCYLLLSTINAPPSELNTGDGILVPTGEANNQTGVDSLSMVECLFAGEGEKTIHTVRITCRIIQRPERFRLVVISAHEGTLFIPPHGDRHQC
jgi:hypothetical protein